jgi:predicted outer membrane repeat protein
LIGAGLAEAATVYVSSAGNDGNTGSTWATAKSTVAAGLAVATSGDQVWVAAGTYVGSITLTDGVGLYGGFAGTETALGQRDHVANVTILDGNAAGSVVTSPDGATTTTRIDGFTIRNGIGKLASGNRFGGGIYCSSSSPTIANNIITGNSADDGAGIVCEKNSSPTIVNNTIAGNTASQLGGGIYCEYYASPTIAGNVIAANKTNHHGGGVFCGYYSSPSIDNNTITGNNAGEHGGAIYSSTSSPLITNTIVAFNSSGIWSSDTETLQYNCVYGNTDYNYTGVADPTGTNGNIMADPVFVDADGADDDDATWQDNDYRLGAGSPCIDAAKNSAVPSGVTTDAGGNNRFVDDPGTTDTGTGTAPIVDMGAYEAIPTTWYRDADGDGYGNAAKTKVSVAQPNGYIADATDCNDSSAAVHPGATEVCGNGIDEDCDGEDAACPTTWYRDADGDGYGNAAKTKTSLTQPSGYVANSTDCNDKNAAIHPGATEVCGNGIDEDCDGQDAACPTTWYRDADGDGYGNAAKTKTSVAQPSGYVADATDCNDSNAAIHPGATDVCGNGIDEDCSGEDTACEPQTYTLRVLMSDGSEAVAPKTYDEGASVQVYAPEAPEGYDFSYWSGDASGSDNPLTVVMNGDKSITANYEQEQSDTPAPVCGWGSSPAMIMIALGLCGLRFTGRRSSGKR